MENRELVNKNETAVIELSPIDRIMVAVKEGLPPEYLEKMLSLQERYDANQAKKLYSKDFASAQSEVKAVLKKKKNEQTHSKYADLSDVIESVQPVYTKYGMAIIFYEGESKKENSVRICADVMHEQGHKESYFLDVPMDGVGIKGNANMTAIHAKASSIAYGRRYLLCMIFNIPTADNDAQNVGVALITNEQLGTLRDLLLSIDDEKNESAICKAFKASSFEELKASEYTKALAIVNARIEQKSKVK